MLYFKPEDTAAKSDDTTARHALAALLDQIDRDTCLHEETHRGGFLWTICSQCARRWADDQGGFVPHTDSLAVANARRVLACDVGGE